MNMRTALRVAHLGARYGRQLCLRDINFEVFAGQVIGVLGTNGAGTPTLFKRIVGALSEPGRLTCSIGNAAITSRGS